SPGNWPARPPGSPLNANGCTPPCRPSPRPRPRSRARTRRLRARPDVRRDGRELAPSGRPGPFPTRHEHQEEVIIVMRGIHGEQYAQVDNAGPFAPAVWPSPVHRTPEWIIWLAQLLRLLYRVIRFVIRHPLLDVAAGVLVLAWHQAGLPGVIAAVTSALGAFLIVRIVWPGWFAKLVTVPLRCRWRWVWCYRRRWRAVLTIAGLGPAFPRQVTIALLRP